MLLLCLTACGKKEPRTSSEIISELVGGYGYLGDRPTKETDRLLKELAAVDPDSAKLWKDILDYWKYAETEMPVNPDSLPEGLPADDSLCITVLGFELNSDGTMQNELIGRLKVALTCAGQYPNAYVLCTGGGTASGNKSATEADLMGEWLVDNGLDEKRLIIENRSLSTVQNAEFSYAILKEIYPQIDSMAIVSSSYHIAWGSLLFEATLMREAAEKGDTGIHIISNAAYMTENAKYRDTLSYEASGLRSILRIR